ncbi:MAG: alpha-hydroxy-acid oxidizing protein [Phycisphaerales bacterium]|nr:alpha-hydroxy-acid oxidizing protein [Phycisphaerales bacterium]
MPDSDPLNLREYAPEAQDSLAEMAWNYYASGADDEITLRDNEAAWSRARLHYRILADVADRSAACTVLGHDLSLPVIAAPTAFHRLADDVGEVATVRATTAAGTAMVLSSLSTVDVEEVMAAATGPVFFQLYLYRHRDVSRDLVRRIEAAGCQALVLTVDAPVWGNRERDVRDQFSLPEGMEIRNLTAEGGLSLSSRGGSGLAEFCHEHLDPGLRWEHVEWLRSITELPIVVKGVCRPDDAERAVEAGVAGLIVSNHGGRQLDTSPATFDVLPAVCEAVDGRAEVWVDGGIRRGTDVLKAIAAGATATLIGRPILWGLAARGEAGVAHVWSILKDEFDRAMALSGCRTVEDITSDLLGPR